MADMELLPTTTLPGAIQESPISCKNCVGLQKTGQNTSSNGSFLEHLKGLIDQHSDQSTGKQLPKLGNDLPNSFLSLVDQVKLDNLPPQLSNILNSIAPFDTEIEQISQQLNTGLKLGQQELVQSISSLASSSLEKLQNAIEAQLEVAGLVEEGKDVVQVVSNQPDIVDLPPLSSISNQHLNLVENATALQRDSLLTKNPAELSIKGKGQLQDKFINVNEIQAKSVKEYLSDDVVSGRALEENLDFELFNHKQLNNTELFHQALSTYKTNSNSLYINPVLPDAAVQRVNIANPIPAAIDLISPTNLKLNSNEGFEAIAQNSGQSLNDNIKWLVNNNIQNARINLYPESLGHVNVSLNLEDTKLTVNFLANSIAAKEIIESNLSSLRDHLNESGIDLEEATVNSQFSSNEEQDTQTSENENKSIYPSLSVNDEDLSNQANIREEAISLHLVDAYI